MLGLTYTGVLGPILLYKKDSEDWQTAVFFSSQIEKRKDLKVVRRSIRGDEVRVFNEIDLLIKNTKVTLVEELPNGGELDINRLTELCGISNLLRRYRGNKIPCNPGAIEASIDNIEDEMRSIFDRIEEKATIKNEIEEIRNINKNKN